MPSKQQESQFEFIFAELKKLGYHADRVLGSGSWGTVVKAYCEEHGTVAIKIIDRINLNESSWCAVEREVESMASLEDHPYIVELLNVCETQRYVYLVLEFCAGGDLLDMALKTKTGLSELQARKLFQQILQAVSHVHSSGYVHRDIKLENILLAADGSARLADFGFARKVKKGERLSEFCGSVHYSAPEIHLAQAYDGAAVDVWALGVTLYALTSAQMPFYGACKRDIMSKSIFGAYAVHDCFSEGLKDLISKALEVNPSKRITLEAMKNHPWVTGRPMVTKKPSLLNRVFHRTASARKLVAVA